MSPVMRSHAGMANRRGDVDCAKRKSPPLVRHLVGLVGNHVCPREFSVTPPVLDLAPASEPSAKYFKVRYFEHNQFRHAPIFSYADNWCMF